MTAILGMDLVSLPPEQMAAAVERLGVAGILVVASYYLMKYFVAQLEKKDERLNEITDRFVQATSSQTQAIERFVGEQRIMQAAMTTAIDKLTVAVDHLQERRVVQRS